MVFTCPNYLTVCYYYYLGLSETEHPQPKNSRKSTRVVATAFLLKLALVPGIPLLSFRTTLVTWLGLLHVFYVMLIPLTVLTILTVLIPLIITVLFPVTP